MENNPYRKNFCLQRSGVTSKTKAMKNDGQMPSHITSKNILKDIQNFKIIKSSALSQKGVVGATSQKASVGGSNSGIRNVHLHNSLPELPLRANPLSTISQKHPGKYDLKISNLHNDVSVSEKESRSIPSISSQCSASKEGLQTILTRLANLEEQNKLILEELRANNALLKNIFKRQHQRTECKKPDCLPFSSVEDLVAFNSASEDQFVEVVNFLSYLGGLNVTDAAARYLKQSLEINQELISKITWTGSKKINTVSLGATKFIAACEQAMAVNKSWISRPTNTEFIFAMNKALKSLKERLRRKLMVPEARTRVQETMAIQDGNSEDEAQEEEELQEEGDDEDADTRESQDLFSLYT